MISISIPYGKRIMGFEVPPKTLGEVLKPHEVTVPGFEAEMNRALEHPIGTKQLADIVHGKSKVAIACEDISRFARTDMIIESLIQRLNRAGILYENMAIIIALGSHRPMTEKELRTKVGESVFSRVQVTNSEFKDHRYLLDLGSAPGGVRIWADKRVIQADVRIGVGSIVPHPALGYTGGAKILYPGVVAEETVARLHLRSAALNKNVMGQADNPARKEMEKWVDTIGLDFIVNSVVTPKNETYAVVAGHYVKAHRRGVEYAKKIYELKAKKKVDVLVVSSHTADQDFWQGTKGVISGERIVKDGGTLILATPCDEGVGPHPSFINYTGSHNYENLLKEAWEGKIGREEVLPLSVGALVARAKKRVNLMLVSDGINEEQARIAGFEYFKTLDEAVQEALKRSGRNAELSVLPYGGDSYAWI